MEFYQVDAFTQTALRGNPAAVLHLPKWLDDATLLKIAQENNLSDTAFFVGSENKYEIRWFTVVEEMGLCGHATLASAHVLFKEKNIPYDDIIFQSRTRGELRAHKNEDGSITLNFPADFPKQLKEEEFPAFVTEALGVKPLELCRGIDDFLALVKDADQLKALKPDFKLIGESNCRGIIATAPGIDGFDFVSRFFLEAEDPFTGSAHCTLTPYWSNKLSKTDFKVLQCSERTGQGFTRLEGDRVYLTGFAKTCIRGNFHLE
mmetsp:Transcript_9757/g.10702  ORF Transcript_9757/g.10702 Transcript_9757/m.10702 type:complete len:262 (+) Transcript_9757:20-805(+)